MFLTCLYHKTCSPYETRLKNLAARWFCTKGLFSLYKAVKILYHILPSFPLRKQYKSFYFCCYKNAKYLICKMYVLLCKFCPINIVKSRSFIKNQKVLYSYRIFSLCLYLFIWIFILFFWFLDTLKNDSFILCS